MNFESAYKLFFDSKLKLQTLVNESLYSKYLSNLEMACASFSDEVLQLGMNLDKVVMDELVNLVNGIKSDFQDQLSDGFISSIYNEFDCRVVFLVRIIEEKRVHENYSPVLIKLGEMILRKDDWSRIYQVLNVLSYHPNTDCIDLVKITLSNLEKNEDFYHGELGHSIARLLTLINDKKAYDLMVESQNIELEGLSEIFKNYVRNFSSIKKNLAK